MIGVYFYVIGTKQLYKISFVYVTPTNMILLHTHAFEFLSTHNITFPTNYTKKALL